MGDGGYGTHIPVLAAAVARTTGPVLECGMGEYSTRMLHLMCAGRKLTSIESDSEWIKQFDKYQSFSHKIYHIEPKIEEWVRYAEVTDEFFDVVFLDQAPGEARIPMALALKGKFKWLLIHDSDADIPPGGGNYGFKNLHRVFKYETMYRDLRPTTTIYSDISEFQL